MGDLKKKKSCKFRLHIKVVLDMTLSHSWLYFCLYLLATFKEQSFPCLLRKGRVLVSRGI